MADAVIEGRQGEDEAEQAAAANATAEGDDASNDNAAE
jgi:hypothetical protein